MTSLQFQLIQDFGELERQAFAWRSLLESSAANGPMLSPMWLLAWWRIYAHRHQLVVGTFRDANRLVGLVPLLRRRWRHRFGIPLRRLELLGSDVDEQDGVCSDYLNIIAESGWEQLVADGFAAAVAGGDFGSWDEVHLSALSGDCVMTEALQKAFCRAGYHVHREQTNVAPHITLPASWDHYLKALPKKSRYHAGRAQRDFDEWAGGSATLHCARAPAEMSEGKRILRSLHSERWAASGGGTYASHRFADFHDAIMPLLLTERALELLWLSVRGEPVAAMYNIVWNNKVYFYQTGRKLDLPSHLRPGFVLITQAIRRAIETGRREFDFLGGAAVYKSQLALAERSIEKLRVSRASLIEGAYRIAESSIARLRRIRETGRSVVHRLASLPVLTKLSAKCKGV